MSKQIIKGDELQLFLQDGAPKFATSHTLTLTGSTLDTDTKDHGFWGSSEVGKLTWELTAECLYTDGDYDNMFDMMIAHTPINLKFAKVSNYSVNGLTSVGGDVQAWTADDSNSRSGKAYITSLTANANTGENATYSVTFTGAGPLKSSSSSSFTVTKTVDWTYEQTDWPNAGDGRIKATFLFNTSSLPQDAHLTENDFWSYITIKSSSHIHYDAARGINPYEVDVWHEMGQSTASVQDTITFKYTDSSNEQHTAVPVNNANVVNWVNPLGEFTFNKTFGWQEAQELGTRKIVAVFQLDVSALPDDSNLQSATWWNNIEVVSANQNNYTVQEYPQDDWMIQLVHTISSEARTFTDTIGITWTDADHNAHRAVPLNESDEVNWTSGNATNSD